MGFDVFRDDHGYTVFLFPPLVPSESVEAGLSRRDLIRRLRSLDVPVRDEMEALWNADDVHKRGWTEALREFRYIRSRAAAGTATPEDAEFIRRHLANPSYPYRRVYLMNTLHMLGDGDEAVAWAALQLSSNPVAEDNQLALELIARHAPERYAAEATAILRSGDPGVKRRAWALAYAGGVMAKAQSPELVDEVARIAGDSNEPETVRYHAQRALAQAVGQLPDGSSMVRFKRRDADLPDLVAKARALTKRAPVDRGTTGDKTVKEDET